MSSDRVIATPCIKICVLDRVTSHCIGCGRTGDEIGAWIHMTADQRQAIMQALPTRLNDMTSGAKGRQRTRTR